MTFEAYARDWLERQNFSKNIRKTTRQSIDYICRAIGPIETSDVAESDVDRIFTDVQLFNRQIDFMERTFRVLNKLFEEIREKGITQNDPALHIYDPVVFSHEKVILEKLDVELTEKSPLNKIAARWPARAVAQFYLIDK